MDPTIAIILTVVAALAGCITLYALFRVIRRVFRSLWHILEQHAPIFGATLASRLMSLGVVALILPNAISGIFEAPIRLVIRVFSAVFNNLNRILMMPSYGSENKIRWDYALGAVVDVLQKIIGDVAQHLNAFFAQIPFSSLILALALWVILGQVFDLLLETTPKNQMSLGKVSDFFTRLPRQTRQNILLAVIFLVSAYLSIAAMVAIPWLKEGEAGAASTRDIRTQLQEALGDQEKFKQSYGRDDAVDPFAALADSVMPQGSFANDTLKTHWEGLLQETKRVRDNYSGQRQQVLAKWQNFLQEVWARKEKLLQEGAGEFESKKRAMGTQEQDFYFREILTWYRLNLDELDKRVLNAHYLIAGRDLIWKSWSDNTKTSLQAAINRLQAPDVNWTMRDLPNIYVIGLYSSDVILEQSLSDFQGVFMLPAMDQLPQPPKPGSQWGIFGLVAGWLLKARTMALVLIIGMLGFGLFGAAISSVVREEKTRQPEEPLVKDLASVVIRGLSAAVVVFLAVEGGVAIFTTNAPEPNPYVLFFTCLVGAVFSERVWEWARERLSQNLGANDQSNSEDQAANKDKPKD